MLRCYSKVLQICSLKRLDYSGKAQLLRSIPHGRESSLRLLSFLIKANQCEVLQSFNFHRKSSGIQMSYYLLWHYFCKYQTGMPGHFCRWFLCQEDQMLHGLCRDQGLDSAGLAVRHSHQAKPPRSLS